MDPLSITSAAAALTVTVVGVINGLCKFRDSLKGAPNAINGIITECKTIKTALAQLQWLADSANPIALSSSAIPQLVQDSFVDALTSCEDTLYVIACELAKVAKGEGSRGTMGIKTRARYVWKEQTIRELLNLLMRQHVAINTLVTLLQAESIAQVQYLLRTKASDLRKTAEDARSIRSCRVETTPPGAGTRSIFNLDLMPPEDAAIDMVVQLQRSAVYQIPSPTTLEELQRGNEELREENVEPRDRVYSLEEEEQRKSAKITSLITKATALQTQVTSLESQLQAQAHAEEAFSAYRAKFAQTGITFTQKFLRDMDKIGEMEAELATLRTSHEKSVLAHLRRLRDACEKPVETALLTPRPSPEPSCASLRPPPPV